MSCCDRGDGELFIQKALFFINLSAYASFFRLYRCSLIPYETDCLLLRSYESPVMLQRYQAKTLPQLPCKTSAKNLLSQIAMVNS